MIEEKRLKINIEILQVGDGRTFINYWDHIYGNDVTTELIDGKLYQDSIEISLQNFIDKVKDHY